jgi:hypothetical protein
MTDPLPFPDSLERRAKRIDAALSRCARGRDAALSGRKEWIEASLDLATELGGARAEHSGDREFGRWLEQMAGDKAPGPHERRILIRWAKDPVQARALMEASESWSIQLIDEAWIRPEGTIRKTPSYASASKASVFQKTEKPSAEDREAQKQQGRAERERARRAEDERFAGEVAAEAERVRKQYAKVDFNFDAADGDVGIVSLFPLTMPEYWALVKLAHPDGEQDPVIKAQKEEVMKILNVKKYQLTGER